FQSPSRRGSARFSTNLAGTLLTVTNFSPLLEGEARASIERNAVQSAHNDFSPLLEGEARASVAPAPVGKVVTIISVPFSKGKRALRRWPYDQYCFRFNFSPLLEGEARASRDRS